MTEIIIKKLKEILPAGDIFQDVLLSEYTSFKIGGRADVLVNPHNIEEISAVVRLAREKSIPFYVLGNGTNMLVADEGFKGIIILIKDKAPEISYSETDSDGRVAVGTSAGCTLARLANDTAARGLSGLEFAAGIPGSVGGAVVMNAGAYGGEIKDVLEFADLLDEDGNVVRLTPEQLELGYRTSIIPAKNYIVLYASFLLTKGNPETIKAEIRELNERRRDKQPLELPSAGSTFKRPAGYFAGKLIEDAGLRGYSVGGAQVSEKHCGFVVNKGGATAEDVFNLISDVITRVYESSGVLLEPEIKLLGFPE